MCGPSWRSGSRCGRDGDPAPRGSEGPRSELDRLGIGYERLSQQNPGLVYCAITGYGQDGPNRDRAGHDINYLALNGILGLTGDADGPPVQSAAQIADLGGGALMALVGILVALRERERSGKGQIVDCSMFDGALSWLALLTAQALAGDRAPARGELALAGSLTCYRPYRCADGYVTLGALEPKFWTAFGRDDLLGDAFDPPGSDAHRAVAGIFAGRTREQWRRFASECDCCLEPVLDLDEVLASPLVAAREMVVELSQPGAQRPVRLLGLPLKLSRTPGDPTRGCGPGLGDHADEVLRDAGFGQPEIAALHASGAVAGPAGSVHEPFMSA